MEHSSSVGFWWAALGLIAQAVFAMRFIWQWLVSEKRGESVVPVGFWWFSLVGGLMLTVYALFRDPVLVPGQAAGIVIYVRNLMLIHKAKSTDASDRVSRFSSGSDASTTREAA